MAVDYIGLLGIFSLLALVFMVILYFVRVDPDTLDRRGDLLTHGVKETQVLHVTRPFEINLERNSSDSLQDSVTLDIKAEFNCHLHQFWGVSSKTFFEQYNIYPYHKDARESERVSSYPPAVDVLVQSSYTHSEKIVEHDTYHQSMTATITPSSDAVEYIERMEASGNHHKAHLVPLVLLLTFSPNDCRSDIIASIYFLCCEKKQNGKIKWNIRSEFLQTINTDVLRVQTLYDSGIQSDEIAEAGVGMERPRGSTSCIVCHHLLATRALLPCRHFCICSVCFHRISQCPVCRCPVNSYLKLGDESQIVLNGFDGERDNARDQIRSMSTFELIRSIWNAS